MNWEGAEKLDILLPSCYLPDALKANGFNHLIKQEQELREGQMNDVLHSLRQSLGDKAWLLWKKLRNVKVISKEDIRLSSEVAEANRVGMNWEKLPWFWHIEEGEEGTAVEVESSK